MKSLWSGSGSHNAKRAKPMNKRARWCGLFLMLLALTALSVLSVRPNLLAVTNTSTPSAVEEEVQQPTERKQTPCEAAREVLKKAEEALRSAEEQEDAAEQAHALAIATQVAVLSDPNSTEEQKKAAQASVDATSEAYDKAVAAREAAVTAVAATQQAVVELCDTQPVEPNPDLFPERREACCGLDVS